MKRFYLVWTMIVPFLLVVHLTHGQSCNPCTLNYPNENISINYDVTSGSSITSGKDIEITGAHVFQSSSLKAGKKLILKASTTLTIRGIVQINASEIDIQDNINFIFDSGAKLTFQYTGELVNVGTKDVTIKGPKNGFYLLFEKLQ